MNTDVDESKDLIFDDILKEMESELNETGGFYILSALEDTIRPFRSSLAKPPIQKDIKKYSVRQLRDICKEAGFRDCRGRGKGELIRLAIDYIRKARRYLGVIVILRIKSDRSLRSRMGLEKMSEKELQQTLDEMGIRGGTNMSKKEKISAIDNDVGLSGLRYKALLAKNFLEEEGFLDNPRLPSKSVREPIESTEPTEPSGSTGGPGTIFLGPPPLKFNEEEKKMISDITYDLDGFEEIVDRVDRLEKENGVGIDREQTLDDSVNRYRKDGDGRIRKVVYKKDSAIPDLEPVSNNDIIRYKELAKSLFEKKFDREYSDEFINLYKRLFLVPKSRRRNDVKMRKFIDDNRRAVLDKKRSQSNALYEEVNRIAEDRIAREEKERLEREKERLEREYNDKINISEIEMGEGKKRGIDDLLDDLGEKSVKEIRETAKIFGVKYYKAKKKADLIEGIREIAYSKSYNISLFLDLNSKKIDEIRKLASEKGVKYVNNERKTSLIDKIMKLS